MALSDNERALVYTHLGYPVMDDGVAIGFGVAHAEPTYRYAERAIVELKPEIEPLVRTLLFEIDEIECEKTKLARTFATVAVGEVKFSGMDGLAALNALKDDKVCQLANLFGAVKNPYALGGGLSNHVREGCW
jgi:hypothetical protein